MTNMTYEPNLSILKLCSPPPPSIVSQLKMEEHQAKCRALNIRKLCSPPPFQSTQVVSLCIVELFVPLSVTSSVTKSLLGCVWFFGFFFAFLFLGFVFVLFWSCCS